MPDPDQRQFSRIKTSAMKGGDAKAIHLIKRVLDDNLSQSVLKLRWSPQSPHSKKVLGSNPVACWSLAVQNSAKTCTLG